MQLDGFKPITLFALLISVYLYNMSLSGKKNFITFCQPAKLTFFFSSFVRVRLYFLLLCLLSSSLISYLLVAGEVRASKPRLSRCLSAPRRLEVPQRLDQWPSNQVDGRAGGWGGGGGRGFEQGEVGTE